MRRPLAKVATTVGLAWFLPAALAFADADETSIHGQALTGLVRTTDHGAVATAPLVGGSLRTTIARSDRWAFEVTLAGFSTRLRHVDATELLGGVPAHGTLERTQLAGRVAVGVQARFGVRTIPTLELAVGVQGRRLGASTLRTEDDTALARIAATSTMDAVAMVGLGLDRRLGRSLVLGVAVDGVAAQPLTGAAGAMLGVEATVHAAWYFYPRWFRLAGWRGSHGGES